MFKLEYGISEFLVGAFVTNRKAVKGISIDGCDNVLMIHTNLGDYKFPGGGICIDETEFDALHREIMEECGYRLKAINDCFCITIERNVDKFEKDKYFEMQSQYYLCSIDFEKRFKQCLDDYEIQQEFTPCWISIDEAIWQNEKLLTQRPIKCNSWVQRETDVLKLLSKSK